MDSVSKPEQKPPRKRARLRIERQDAEAVVNGESLTALVQNVGVANLFCTAELNDAGCSPSAFAWAPITSEL